MGKVNFFIDGSPIIGEDSEPILNIARARGIFIPAICYLNRCSASLACRLCLVEADGKQVFACNAKPKEGMQVVTNSEEIKRERRAIMEVYDVNHPLECGVCDKSGSCELQNYTLEMGVDSQNYSVPDCSRPIKNWGLVKYDASLCIVCERCVTVCKDMVGDSALTTVPRGGAELDKVFKETMPKNAFTIWNKMNKSIIGAKAGDKLDCTMCGECIAVCPVGALTASDFTYKSNAWELETIPSACSHCSSACFLNYEVKHTAIENNDQKIYRVTNEWNYQSLCGAGRFGFDYANSGKKDNEILQNAINAVRNAKTIKFNSYITNEEALMLQTLKETLGVKLVNAEANSFTKFISSYSDVVGCSLYDGDTKAVHSGNFIVTLGSDVKSSAPMIRFAMNNALSMNKGAALYIHPVFDSVIGSMNKNLLALTNKAGSDEAVMWLLLDLFADKTKLPAEHSSYLESMSITYKKTVTEKVKKKIEELVVEKLTDENGVVTEVEKTIIKEIEESSSKEIEVRSSKLFEIVGLEMESIEKIEALYAKKDRPVLILGSDLFLHPRASKIATLAGLLKVTSSFSVVIIPSATNTLGVSQICKLDEQADGYTIGYNTAGDYRFSSIESEQNDCQISFPALNQQEGTFVSVDKRVVILNPALSFEGYELNDVMNGLGIGEKYSVDWTKKLPEEKGFKNIEFDELSNSFGNDGSCKIGYILDAYQVSKTHNIAFEPIDTTIILGQNVAYASNPVLQFNDFTAKCELIKSNSNIVVCSEYFAQGHVLSDGDKVLIEINDNKFEFIVEINKKLIGNTLLVPTFSSKSLASKMFENKYAFQSVTLTKG